MSHNEAATLPARGPLNGVRVLDLTRVLAGPYCTMVLADLGATVIKVEVPGTGDDSRAYGPFVNGQSAYFQSLNRGKSSIALHLKAECDRSTFERLLAASDVVVENYRPGTMEKLGYGWEALHSRFPRLIYAAASGFGHTGPYAKRAAYDMVVQAMGGIMSVTGHAGAPPVRVGSSIGDITAGLFTAVGINAALLHRATSGEAIKVDVAMLDCQVAILENAIARYAATGDVAGPIGARHPSITPFAAFEACDGWMVVAAGNDALFRALTTTLGQPGLAGEARFATNALRTESWEPLFELLGQAFATRSIADWLAALEAAGVPCGPINMIDKVLADLQIKARNMVVTATDPVSGAPAMTGNPIKLSAFPDPATRSAAPRLDGDRAAILAALAPPAAAALSHSGPGDGDSGAFRPQRYLEHIWRVLARLTTAETTAPDTSLDAGRFRQLARALLSERGEVMGTAIAAELVGLLRRATLAERLAFLSELAETFGPRPEAVEKAIAAWRAEPTPNALARLAEAAEPRRQELFRRINMAPGGTASLIALRADLLDVLRDQPGLACVDADMRHLFASWFNRGFLELRRIDWRTPAIVLEKLIAYEAVHAIDGWDDLRRRLAEDRRCFGFFHPALPDEPLIFVEVALTDTLSDRIEPIIRAPLALARPPEPKAAIFYSISNCQPGLRGVSFGNLLIKQVVHELRRELPSLATFATLSPIPGLRRWLERADFDMSAHLPADLMRHLVASSGGNAPLDWILAQTRSTQADNAAREAMLRLAARYLAGTGEPRGPTDPVARFHLGNGARIERINFAADHSDKATRQAAGMMVNYLYDLDAIAENHDAFANGRTVAMSASVKDIAGLDNANPDRPMPDRIGDALSRIVRRRQGAKT